MARWKLKSPQMFRKDFHEALHYGEGKDQVITRAHTNSAVRAARDDWNLFLYCCRNWQGGEYERLEQAYERRTSIGYNHELGRWELRVTVSSTATTLLRNAKVLEIPIDKPQTLP